MYKLAQIVENISLILHQPSNHCLLTKFLNNNNNNNNDNNNNNNKLLIRTYQYRLYVSRNIVVHILVKLSYRLLSTIGIGPSLLKSSKLDYSYIYSMCSLVVSVLDSPAVDPRSNPGSGSALLMREKISGCILHLQLSYANSQSALQ